MVSSSNESSSEEASRKKEGKKVIMIFSPEKTEAEPPKARAASISTFPGELKPVPIQQTQRLSTEKSPR